MFYRYDFCSLLKIKEKNNLEKLLNAKIGCEHSFFSTSGFAAHTCIANSIGICFFTGSRLYL